MTVPSFVNAGTGVNQSFGTSLSVTLPGSRVNGNILIAVVSNVKGSPYLTFAFPVGWTLIDQHIPTGTGSAPCFAVYYRFVDGTESAPNVTWTGNAAVRGQCYQYTGVYNATPLGNTNIQFTANGTSTQWATPAMTTLGTDSVALQIFGGNTGSLTITAPSGWTIDGNSGGTGGTTYLLHQDMPTPGNTNAISGTPLSTTCGWTSLQVELRSQAAGGGGGATPPQIILMM